MKKLNKKINKSPSKILAYCSCSMCGCYCRPYEDNTSERYASKEYSLATAGA